MLKILFQAALNISRKVQKVKLKTILLTILLAACGGEQNTATAPAQTDAASVATGTVVEVASDLRYEPYIFMDGNGHPMGLDVDILNAIGQKKGLTFQYNVVPWDELFENMQQRGTQVVANGLARDDADGDAVAFSEPYINSLDCVATLNEDAMKNWTKNRIATVPDDELIEELMPLFRIDEKQVVSVNSVYLGLTSMLKKEADAFVSDCTAIRYYAHGETLKDSNYVIQELTHSSDANSSDLVFAVRNDQSELLQKINEGLTELKQSGELDQIKAKWRQEVK